VWQLLIGVLIGLIIGYFFGNKTSKKVSVEKKDKTNQYDFKEENIEKLLDFISGKKEITNDEVQEELRISDATSTRYLDELEKRGVVKQIGKTGQSVKYKIK